MSEPVYIKVASAIEEQIESGKYKIKEKLPSERVLANLFEVSRMTARQAVILLEEKGIVYRERGSGTFVQAPVIAQKNVKSFTETVGDLGYEVHTKVIEFSTVHNVAKISRELDVPITTHFYKIKRLRFGNNIPMALELLYIPKGFLADLENYSLENSFYGLLEEEYDLTISKVSYKMEAVIANTMYTKLMELKKQTPLLKVSGISFDHNGRKILYEESVYRSDLYSYQVDINRKY